MKADNIVPALPAGTVLIWVTPTIARDYERRQAFPTLRASLAIDVKAHGALYGVSMDEAKAILADADERRQHVAESPLDRREKAALSLALGSLRKHLQREMERATKRVRVVDSGPLCEWQFVGSEEWTGTKEQLRSRLGIDGSFPDEAGKQWCNACDSRGFPVKLSPTGSPGKLFSASIVIPESARNVMREVTARHSAEHERLQHLKSLPTTAEAFKKHAAETYWGFVGVIVAMLQPKDGYRLTDEAIEEFRDAAADAYHAILEADTTGRSPRQLLQASAKADAPLQAFIAKVRHAGGVTGESEQA